MGRRAGVTYPKELFWAKLPTFGSDEAEQFQGFHSPNMLIVVDEAEGVAEPIYEAIDAVMTASNSKLLLIGNPTSDSGAFRRAFHEDRRIFNNITISVLESPNVGQSLPLSMWASMDQQDHAPYGETSCMPQVQEPSLGQGLSLATGWSTRRKSLTIGKEERFKKE